MAQFVSLLRGINVSGKNAIAMAELRALYEQLGLSEVRSYVQSGNVLFASRSGSPGALEKKIEAAVAKTFGASVTVLVRKGSEIERLLRENPFATEPKIDPTKLHVTFLAKKPSAAALAKLAEVTCGRERFHAAGHHIYLHCPDGYGRAKLNNNLLERKLAVAATTRNWRTVTRLVEMLG